MSLRKIKLFIGVLVLLAYVSIGVFGLFQMNHHTTQIPMNDCPYALNSYSMCDNGLSHINNWKQFFNVVFLILLTLSVFLFIVVLYFFDRNLFKQNPHLFYQWMYYLDDKVSYIFRNRIIRWLYLFENSPPVNTR